MDKETAGQQQHARHARHAGIVPYAMQQPTTYNNEKIIYYYLFTLYTILLITPLYYDKRLNIYIAIVEYTDLRVLNCTQYHLINTFIDK